MSVNNRRLADEQERLASTQAIEGKLLVHSKGRRQTALIRSGRRMKPWTKIVLRLSTQGLPKRPDREWVRCTDMAEVRWKQRIFLSHANKGCQPVTDRSILSSTLRDTWQKVVA